MATGKKTGGRKAGTPNKVTASIKEAIEQAFDQVGGVAYLVGQAKDNPVAFMGLIGRVLPKDVTVKVSELAAVLSAIDGSAIKPKQHVDS